MSPAFRSVEALWSRTLHHAPPRGTSPRILKRRLQRAFHTSRRRCAISGPVPTPMRAQSLARSTFPPPLAKMRPPAPFSPAPAVGPAANLNQDDVSLLQQLFRHNWQKAQAKMNNPMPPDEGALVQTAADTPSVVSSSVGELLVPMQRQQPAALASALARLGSPDCDSQQAMDLFAQLPRTTFSELLRCLDPLAVGPQLDPAHDMHIRPATARFTRLGLLVDEFGARVVYKDIFDQIVRIVKLRRGAGEDLVLGDYQYLLRFAGAMSDPHAARVIWNLMDEYHDRTGTNLQRWRHADLYADFVQARFLTEPLFSQHDLASFRITPLTLFGQKLKLRWSQVYRLEALRVNYELKQTHRFAHDPADDKRFAQGLMAVLRLKRPVLRVVYKILRDRILPNEKLLCAMMVAFSRSGALRQMDKILAKKYRIHVKRNRADGTVVVLSHGDPAPASGQGVPDAESGFSLPLVRRVGSQYAQDDPLRPTARILEAIVRAYCTVGEIGAALKLMDVMARTYEIPIPRKTWSFLLQWTYVMTTRPATTEWKMAGWPGKVYKPDAVMLVWSAMTSPPYSVRPSFGDRVVLTKALLERRQFDKALAQLGRLKASHDALAAEHRDALLALAFARARGLGAAAEQPLHARGARLGARRVHAWYEIRTLVWKLLRATRSSLFWPRSPCPGHVLVPEMIEALAAFVPSIAEYHVRTGTVQIRMEHVHDNLETARLGSRRGVRSARYFGSRRTREQSAAAIMNRANMKVTRARTVGGFAADVASKDLVDVWLSERFS